MKCDYCTEDYECRLVEVTDDNPIAMLMRILLDVTFHNINNGYGDTDGLANTLLWDIHRAHVNGITICMLFCCCCCSVVAACMHEDLPHHILCYCYFSLGVIRLPYHLKDVVQNPPPPPPPLPLFPSSSPPSPPLPPPSPPPPPLPLLLLVTHHQPVGHHLDLLPLLLLLLLLPLLLPLLLLLVLLVLVLVGCHHLEVNKWVLVSR